MNSEYTDITHAGFWQVEHSRVRWVMEDANDLIFWAPTHYNIGKPFTVTFALHLWPLNHHVTIRGKELFKVIEVLPDRVIMQSLKR